MSSQMKPLRWFSIISTSRPWSSPNQPSDSQPSPVRAKVGLKPLENRSLLQTCG